MTLAEDAKRMIFYGFGKEKPKDKDGKELEGDKLREKLDSMSEEELLQMADMDEVEYVKDQMVNVPFPKTDKKFMLVFDSMSLSLEESYFWLLHNMRNLGFPVVEKITDVFTASEMSAMAGVQQQRTGAQQDKVSQFMATIGRMVKELFQIVRDLRILDQRMKDYNDSMEGKRREEAEITLKGMYVDLVEGASKNPASVIGMASQLDFVTLPDFFFSIHPRSLDDIGPAVDKCGANQKVKEVLKRKLRGYLSWKLSTMKEHETKRKFTLQYLRQHMDAINMYMHWVKPYLRTIRRLQPDESRTEWPELIGAFESASTEIEILGRGTPKDNKQVQSIIILHMDYTTKPSLNYQAEGFQRGPIHVGQLRVSLRSYAWADEQVENYKKMRKAEEFDMMKSIDTHVKAAMEALGDELFKYLEEAGSKNIFGERIGTEEEKDGERPKPPSVFSEIFAGFGDLWSVLKNDSGKLKRQQKQDSTDKSKEAKTASKEAAKAMGKLYIGYKKSHGLVSW